MQTLATEIPGVLVVQPPVFEDERGVFVKTYSQQSFADAGITFEPEEEFFSVSRAGVVRGMHFQLPPAAHAKLVYCASGAVLDVVLDLRKNSPAYGRAISRELNERNREMLLIPVGCAHGFAALSDRALMFYQTSRMHSPPHDAGVRWDSFGFGWPIASPILSARDRALPPVNDFDSPF